MSGAALADFGLYHLDQWGDTVKVDTFRAKAGSDRSGGAKIVRMAHSHHATPYGESTRYT